MRVKEKQLLPVDLLDNKRSFSQYNLKEVTLFRSCISAVHTTPFFELLKIAIPHKAVPVISKVVNAGTEDGAIVGSTSCGSVVTCIALMAIVVAHPDG